MNIWKHSLLSEKKFGGKANDYLEIHKFLDASKLFYFHFKHRALLHHTFGIEICTRLFGDCITNSSGDQIVVRDIAAEHCKEDLNNYIPTLFDWFKDNQNLEKVIKIIPITDHDALNKFILSPLMKTNLKSSLIITCSDFGVFLAEQLFGFEAAQQLRQQIPPEQNVKSILKSFRITEMWQCSPNMKALELLNEPKKSV